MSLYEDIVEGYRLLQQHKPDPSILRDEKRGEYSLIKHPYIWFSTVGGIRFEIRRQLSERDTLRLIMDVLSNHSLKHLTTSPICNIYVSWDGQRTLEYNRHHWKGKAYCWQEIP